MVRRPARLAAAEPTNTAQRPAAGLLPDRLVTRLDTVLLRRYSTYLLTVS
ncbi:hypothetical protein [Nonomuraea sp. NPDC049695]